MRTQSETQVIASPFAERKATKGTGRMRIRFSELMAITFCLWTMTASNLQGKENSSTSSEESPSTELVRVKPAEIGPKSGRNDESGDGRVSEESFDDSAAIDLDDVTNQRDGAALEIIFDCSNSMNARINGVAKIDLAKQALYHLTDTLEQTNLQVGFRVFGHNRTIDRKDRTRACGNSELVIPITADSTARIRSSISGLLAWGLTPIAYSFEEAGKDLDPFLENSPMLLLISDGMESCGGDPVSAILDVRRRGVNVRTFVIGFDLNAQERAALEMITEASEGIYYNARDYGELLESFDQFSRDTTIASPTLKEKYSNPAQGGSSFEQANVIGPGRYTVWRDLAKNEWGHFKVESKKGQRVAVRAVIQSNAVYRDKSGKFHEAPYTRGGAMIRFFSPQGSEIKGRKILLRGDIGEWQRQHTLDLTGIGSHFAIGDDYGPTSRHVMFDVIVQEAGDLYEGWEAPDSVKSTGIFEAPLNDAFYGHLGTEDKVDVYELDLKSADHPESINLSLRFSDVDNPCRFLVELYDSSTKRRVARFIKLQSEVELDLPTAGMDGCYLLIKDNNPTLYHLMNSYRIVLQRAS